MQQEHQDVENALDAQHVVHFLNSNPEFFEQHSGVLAKLRIPHDTGGAVSLIEKQVSVLRSKCQSLENKLSELILVATENEQLQKRLHLLTQEIVSAASLDEAIDLTRASLIENFHADNVKVLLIDREGQVKHETFPERFVAYDDQRLRLMETLYASMDTYCGKLEEKVGDFLFGEEASSVGSAAIIPLQHDTKIGLAVLSSKDEYRFESGKGVIFLNQLGEVLSRRLSAFMQD